MFKKYKTIADLLAEEKDTEKNIVIRGTVKHKRNNGKFIDIYDVEQDTLQIVQNVSIIDLPVGTYIECLGKFKLYNGKYDFVANEIKIIGKVRDQGSYIQSVKSIPIESLRGDKCHYRSLFDTTRAISKISSETLKYIYEFMEKHRFIKSDPNIFTQSDCEGGGEGFIVCVEKDIHEHSEHMKMNKYEKTFLGKKISLQVSSQLPLEAIAKGFDGVWTDNTSFRADPSMSRRHLCEFKHIEVESRHFDTLEQLMSFEEDLVKYVIDSVLKSCKSEYVIIEQSQPKLVDRLMNYIKCDFGCISYDEAIILIEKHKKDIYDFHKDFKFVDIPKWGDDLGSVCERFLTEIIFKKPLFIKNFPRSLKSFYMKITPNDDDDDFTTMQGCDLLIPYLGELIGGSVRENDYDVLMTEIKRRKMDITPIQWYVDLRRNGSIPTGGFGLGFGRLVSVLCSLLPEIQDATPFPVAYQRIYY